LPVFSVMIKKREVFRGAPPPSCNSPDRLRGRAFNETSVDEFLCRPPQLTRVEVTANDTAGRLTCAASGEPVPTIYWIQPSGTATRFSHSTVDTPDAAAAAADNDDVDNGDGAIQENEGSLMIESLSLNSAGVESSSLVGMYICVANNAAGNVTLTISVPAGGSGFDLRPQPPAVVPSPVYKPSTSLPSVVHHSSTPYVTANNKATPTTSSTNKSTAAAGLPVQAIRPAAAGSGQRQQSFTLSQLVVAVVFTHIVTLLFYVMLAAVCYWTRCAQGVRNDLTDRASHCTKWM